ncbi:MAG: hemerythrin domain-containing protein [Actinomycetota bacterium]|nr:hemerythrin domain-containing protein [Actinomycetota bacterium]
MTDVVTLIKAQHREMERLLDQASQADADMLSLLHQVNELLIPHSEAEDNFVYPAIEKADSEQGEEVKDGVAEHRHIEDLLEQLLEEDPGDPGYDGKLAAMVGELRHHIEEEQELLPVLAEKVSSQQRADLAVRFVKATGWIGGDSASKDDQPTRDELYEKTKEPKVPAAPG